MMYPDMYDVNDLDEELEFQRSERASRELEQYRIKKYLEKYGN